MASLLESKAEIASAQRKLEAAIRKSFKGRATMNIGYPGGTERGAKVVTDCRHWYWSADHPAQVTPNPRRLNWFGLMPGAGSSNVEISVEINTPYEGKNNQVGGFFGRIGQQHPVGDFVFDVVDGDSSEIRHELQISFRLLPVREPA